VAGGAATILGLLGPENRGVLSFETSVMIYQLIKCPGGLESSSHYYINEQ